MFDVYGTLNLTKKSSDTADDDFHQEKCTLLENQVKTRQDQVNKSRQQFNLDSFSSFWIDNVDNEESLSEKIRSKWMAATQDAF